MTVADLLLAFLGAVVALAGFSGIVSSIDRRTAGVSRELVSFRLRNMVTASLSTIVLAVSPLLVLQLTQQSDTVWPLFCIIAATWLTYLNVWTISIRQRFRGDTASGIRLGFYYVLTPASAGVVLMLGAGVLGYLPADACYATAVFWCLLRVAAFFSLLVFALDESLE
jgi:hypothetical protein